VTLVKRRPTESLQRTLRLERFLSRPTLVQIIAPVIETRCVRVELLRTLLPQVLEQIHHASRHRRARLQALFRILIRLFTRQKRRSLIRASSLQLLVHREEYGRGRDSAGLIGHHSHERQVNVSRRERRSFYRYFAAASINRSSRVVFRPGRATKALARECRSFVGVQSSRDSRREASTRAGTQKIKFK